MRHSRKLVLILLPAALLAAYFCLTPRQVIVAQGPAMDTSRTVIRIAFQAGPEPVTWDGMVRVSAGRVASITGWRFVDGDQVDGAGGWKATTHRFQPQGAAGQNLPQDRWPVAPNGVFLTLEGVEKNTRVSVETAQGNFDFSLGDIPFGAEYRALNGRALIDRTALSTRLTSGPDEDDFPSGAAAGDGAVWVAFVRFTHNAEYQRRGRALGTTAPENFDLLAAPPGGDQVMLLKYSANRWSEPIPVTPTGRDVYKTAVAIDGNKRVWTLWSEQVNGNFDIYARPLDGTALGETIRLTTNSEPDLIPAAATDKSGLVWVAWQGFRNGRAAILAARQAPKGDSFLPETVVAAPAGNAWDPAVAASPRGGVAFAWDDYRKGDYDIYLRTADAGGKLGAEKLVAGSLKAEMRPTLAYDQDDRIWVAWEEASERWGKDWGAYETSGTSLYQVRQIRVKCFAGDQAYVTAQDVEEVLPQAPAGPGRGAAAKRGRRAAAADGVQRMPNPELVKQRPPSGNNNWPVAPLNDFARLAADAEGRVWLAYRTAFPTGRGPLGTVWYENVVYYDGAQWHGPVFVPNSANLQDVRPAVVSPGGARMFLIGVSDGRTDVPVAAARRAVQQAAPQAGGVRAAKAAKKALRAAGGRQQQAAAPDQFQNDLYVADLSAGEPLQSSPKLTAVAAERAATPEPDTAAEAATVKRMQTYRVEQAGRTMELMRGEFHRHTEISGDGGRDGPLIDAWRYGLDAAGMDWMGCCDHDNGNGREYSWWITQKMTDAFHDGTRFVPLFSYERSVVYPEGHRNVLFAQRGVRPLARLMPRSDENSSEHSPDTLMLYKYLKRFDGVCASHTSGTNMGTDWRDNDPALEPVVEIYQGDRQNYEMPGAPRSNTEGDSIGGWRPKGFVSLALLQGYRLGFQASSDHISTHMSFCNIFSEKHTREAMMDALKKRHVYGSTDNIVADVRSGSHFMGDEFETAEPPVLQVRLVGTAPFATVQIVKDNQYVYTTEPNTSEVQFTWRDNAPAPGKISYYYVRGEQRDGELVWVSPMWIKYTGR